MAHDQVPDSLFDACSTYSRTFPPRKHKCGYCKSQGSASHGMLVGRLTCLDYQELIDLGWRRSGTYLYKPDNLETCCPCLTIRLDAQKFEANKAQKKLLRRFMKHLHGKEDISISKAGTDIQSAEHKADSTFAGHHDSIAFHLDMVLLDFVQYLLPTIDTSTLANRRTTKRFKVTTNKQNYTVFHTSVHPHYSSAISFPLYKLLKLSHSQSPLLEYALEAINSPAKLAEILSVEFAKYSESQDYMLRIQESSRVKRYVPERTQYGELIVDVPKSDIKLESTPNGYINITLGEGYLYFLPTSPKDAPDPGETSNIGSAVGIKLSVGDINDAMLVDNDKGKGKRSSEGKQAHSLRKSTSLDRATASSSQDGASITTEDSFSNVGTAYEGIETSLPRVHKRDWKVVLKPAAFDEESFALYQKYQMKIHGDTLDDCDIDNYIRFLCESPLIPETFSHCTLKRAMSTLGENNASSSIAASTAGTSHVGGKHKGIEQTFEVAAMAFSKGSEHTPLQSSSVQTEKPTSVKISNRNELMFNMQSTSSSLRSRLTATNSDAIPHPEIAKVTPSQALNCVLHAQMEQWIHVYNEIGKDIDLVLASNSADIDSTASAASISSKTTPDIWVKGMDPTTMVFPNFAAEDNLNHGVASRALESNETHNGDENPLQSVVIPGYGSYHMRYYLDGELIAVGVVDILPKCLSSVYVFYDPDRPELNMGKITALFEIQWVQYMYHNYIRNLRYYYMGYYIHSCPKMRYKAEYTPSEVACPLSFAKWLPYSQAKEILDSDSRKLFLTEEERALFETFHRNQKEQLYWLVPLALVLLPDIGNESYDTSDEIHCTLVNFHRISGRLRISPHIEYTISTMLELTNVEFVRRMVLSLCL